ncbi:FMN-binding protein, partial [Stecheria intestinalis]|uniref:FMN-binding protein n=1 Tax=Stecheria intestinalis TaxID=2606630 RepID=UPI0023F29AC1
MKGNKVTTSAVCGLFAVAAVLGSLGGCGQGTSSSAASGKTGTYHGEAQGFGGIVAADVTFDNGKITDVVLTGDSETPTVGGAALEKLKQQVLDAGSADIDGVSGATMTSNGVRGAVQAAIDATEEGTAAADADAALSFKAGTYTGSSEGYNGPVELDVTFSDSGIDDIQVKTSSETAHVGDVAYDIMFADAKEAGGSGIDSVSGATFTSRAIKAALDDAAEQAGVSDLSAFQKKTVKHTAGDPIEETYDVVVIGGGGAGLAAAAQAVQNGDSVVVVEENAEIGGNTLVSGGQFQSVMPYLVWDPADPEATEGT